MSESHGEPSDSEAARGTPSSDSPGWPVFRLSSWLGGPRRTDSTDAPGGSAASAAAAIEHLQQWGFICFENDVGEARDMFARVHALLEGFFGAPSEQKHRFALRQPDGAFMKRTCGYHVDSLYQRECLRIIERHGDALDRAYGLAAEGDDGQAPPGGDGGERIKGGALPLGLVGELRAAAALLRALCLEVLRAAQPEAAEELAREHRRSGDPSVVDAFRYDGERSDAALYMTGHCDPGVFTVHPVVRVPGLQVALPGDGGAAAANPRWLDVEARCGEGDLVIWAGERLPRLAGAHLQPTRHRVRCSAAGPRVSLTFELKDHASNYGLELLPPGVVSSVVQLAGLLPAPRA